LSTHLRLGLASGLFPSGFPTNILFGFLSPHSCYMPCPSHPPWLDRMKPLEYERQIAWLCSLSTRRDPRHIVSWRLEDGVRTFASWKQSEFPTGKRLWELRETCEECGRRRHREGKIDDSSPFCSSHLWFIVITSSFISLHIYQRGGSARALACNVPFRSVPISSTLAVFSWIQFNYSYMTSVIFVHEFHFPIANPD
jgi:hypothetical protein